MGLVPAFSDRLKPGNRENVVDITNFFASFRQNANGPANGGLGLDVNNITPATADLLAIAGAHRGKSIVLTEQSTPAEQNNIWHKMPTPDQVTVTLPTDGLIIVAFKALWRGFSTP